MSFMLISCYRIKFTAYSLHWSILTTRGHHSLIICITLCCDKKHACLKTIKKLKDFNFKKFKPNFGEPTIQSPTPTFHVQQILTLLIKLPKQYLCFDRLPHSPGGRNQGGSQWAHLSRKASFWAKIPTGQCVEDFIYRGVGWESAVKHTELAFESLGDIIAATSRVDHGSRQLQVDYADEFPRPFQAVETSLHHQLTNNLISDLRGEQKH